ncbi:MAG: endonuclease/exonuclease/phosphatase family protein [Flavobacteriaceae bacterium]
MKRFRWFHKSIWFLNILAALLLMLAVWVPQITSERFGFLSLLSLTVPLLVLANFIFLGYWFLVRRKRSLLSVVALALHFLFSESFLRLNTEASEGTAQLTVLSYNVRGFNKFGDIDNPHVFEDTKNFVKEMDPDIICFQEVSHKRQKEYSEYPYRYLEYIHHGGKVLLGIFSKYPIVDSGLLDFPTSYNNGAYADIALQNDTIRVYNVHMESLGVTDTRVLTEERSDRLFKRLSHSFEKQVEQAKMVRNHMDTSPYRTLLCGDFNNTQYSSVYTILKGDMQDTFIEKGHGYGRTYEFLGFPIRIDFILADASFQVARHQNFNVRLSDHYPLMASFDMVPEE